MDEDDENRRDITERDEDAAAGVNNEPRGNPDVDQDALDKGKDQMERVKPY